MNKDPTARMEPARSVIAKLGGEAVVSKITKTAYTAPYRWQYPVEKKGTGGIIPQRHHRTLLDFARSSGIKLSAEEFLALPRLQSRQQRGRSPRAA